jgi:hypothetical protein
MKEPMLRIGFNANASRSRARCLLALALALIALAAGAAPAGAAIRVQAIPGLPGLRFDYAGTRLISDAHGRVLVPTDDARGLRTRLHLLPTTLRHGVHARFSGWRRGRVTYTVVYRVRPSFVDPRGDHIDPSRISAVDLRGPAGSKFTIPDGRPIWLPGNRIVPVGRRPVSRNITWAVERVMAGGANVVTRSQQRITPAHGVRPRLKVRFYTLHFTAHDALLGSPIGSRIILRYPDGHEEGHPAGSGGGFEFGSLPRGSYTVRVEAPGFASSWPVALSRNQDLGVSVISYVDVLLGGAVLGALALALLLAGRPSLRRRMRPHLRRRAVA